VERAVDTMSTEVNTAYNSVDIIRLTYAREIGISMQSLNPTSSNMLGHN
jgi:hypothetical protein